MKDIILVTAEMISDMYKMNAGWLWEEIRDNPNYLIKFLDRDGK